MNKIRRKVGRWKAMDISLVGRVTLINVWLLSKFWY